MGWVPTILSHDLALLFPIAPDLARASYVKFQNGDHSQVKSTST